MSRFSDHVLRAGETPENQSPSGSCSCSLEASPESGPALRGNPLVPGLESSNTSERELQSIFLATEESLVDLQDQNLDESGIQEEALRKRKTFEIKPLEEQKSTKEGLAEIINSEAVGPASTSGLFEQSGRNDVYSEILDSISSIKECFWRISGSIDEAELDNVAGGDPSVQGDLVSLLAECRDARDIGLQVESKIFRYKEMKEKLRKDLENSIQCLTEENGDISDLLRVAVLEKEAAEKSLNKLRGGGEQKRMAIIQIAEWGLQKAGFGFMMGASSVECPADNQISCNVSVASDVSECEEDDISLASTVGKIIKNLRHEITELRCSLEEFRSMNGRLQALTLDQSKEIADHALHIKVLEEKEIVLTQNIEKLNVELRGAEEEATRWREACLLEVEAGKTAIEECEKEIASLKEDVGRTKAELDISNSKLELKDKLAATAMAAQAAAETSLRLADSRWVGLRERIEELTRQLEEEAERGRKERRAGRRGARYMCWPWRGLAVAASISSVRRARRRMSPDTVALLD